MNSLFKPILEGSDQKYLDVRDNPRYRLQKEYLEELWKIFSPYADPDFKVELAKQFHPRFWEMYLTRSLIDKGFELIRRKTSYGPDIQIRIDGRTLWIEATTSGTGIGEDAVPGFSDLEWMTVVPEEKIILRLTNSLQNKCVNYQKYVSSGLISKDDYFVVAINGSAIPNIDNDDEVPYIVKSVLPIGYSTVNIDLKSKKASKEFHPLRDHITKNSGVNVSTKIYQDLAYSYLSGVLFSTAGLWNLPVCFGDDFMYLHNPNANHQLSKKWFGRGNFFWVEGAELMSLRGNDCRE